MFAAATTAPDNSLPFNWFDLVFVVLIIFGLLRGRHNGMSKELFPMLQWLLIVFLCGLVYPMLSDPLEKISGLSRMWSMIITYAVLMLLVMIPFSMLKHHFGAKLVAADYFKGNEFYLGMLAGVVRYLCIILVVLAFLNAPVYSPADLARRAAYLRQTYGGGESGFSGNLFPSLPDIQQAVFKKSFVGTSFKNQSFVNSLLINSKKPGEETAAVAKPKAVMSIGGKTVTLENTPAPNPPKK